MTIDKATARQMLAEAGARYARNPRDRWSPVPPELDGVIAADATLATVARLARAPLVDDVIRRLWGLIPDETMADFADALLTVPRERFVLPEDIGQSAEDTPLPLDREGLATVSAPHAYVLSFGLLGLCEGDFLVELGTGTGYGAALGAHIVGAYFASRAGAAAGGASRPGVLSIEIDTDLVDRASRLLSGVAGVTVRAGDATLIAPSAIQDAAREVAVGRLKVTVTYAIAAPPTELLDVLPEGAVLVVPIGVSDGDQSLVRWTRAGGLLRRSVHGHVRYVAERR